MKSTKIIDKIDKIEKNDKIQTPNRQNRQPLAYINIDKIDQLI